LKSFQPELFQNDKFQIIFIGPVNKEVDLAKVWTGKEFKTRKVQVVVVKSEGEGKSR
jgi:hypothetical protein